MCERVCVYVFYLPEQRSHSDLYILLSAPAMHSTSIIHNAHKHFRTKKNRMKENGTLQLYNLDRASEVYFILFIKLIIFLFILYILKNNIIFLYIIFFLLKHTLRKATWNQPNCMEFPYDHPEP